MQTRKPKEKVHTVRATLQVLDLSRAGSGIELIRPVGRTQSRKGQQRAHMVVPRSAPKSSICYT